LLICVEAINLVEPDGAGNKIETGQNHKRSGPHFGTREHDAWGGQKTAYKVGSLIRLV